MREWGASAVLSAPSRTTPLPMSLPLNVPSCAAVTERAPGSALRSSVSWRASVAVRSEV